VNVARHTHPLLATIVLIGAAAVHAAPDVGFRLDEGRNINTFVRDGKVAAHLLLRSGTQPRILVAFPAGNSGVGLWFVETDERVAWTLASSPRPITLTDTKGRPLHGIETEAAVDAPALRIERAVLSSVRVLRDYEARRTVPDEVTARAAVNGQHISWTRDRLDGAAGYRLEVEALGDAIVSTSEIKRGPSGGRLRLKVRALSGEPPLTPLGGSALLKARAANDARSRDVLTFLSYREKYLAGSWRFNTYFGRDTLMSLMLLAPALQPDAIEGGIRSVLERLAPSGEVAHEEDIGEFAVLRNAKEGRGRSDTPIYDYGMVDDDYMLAPLAARYLADTVTGRSRATAFLATPNANGVNTGDALVRNFEWVVGQTADFARDPSSSKLIQIKRGRNTGQWRDSEEGLGRGRFPYDINVALAPAALRGIHRLVRSGLLDPYLTTDQRRVLSQAGTQADVWSEKAPPLFVVSVPINRARADITAYASSIGMKADAAIASLQGTTLEFNALALDAQGQAVPIMHSDDGFALLFATPTPAQLERAIGTVARPFPAGLATPIGMLVANPALASSETQARFTNAEYHGTVVWSWQQALMAAGLDRQISRTDLPVALRARLIAARADLWSSILAAGHLRTSELWSWSFDHDCFRPEAFGQRRRDVDESNAAQLWSTVFLALPPPRAITDPQRAYGLCRALR
jgi:hypothetical protein